MSVALFRLKNIPPEREKRQWNNQEIADFYRAVDILKRAGLDVEVDSGVTDEGEPWFVFVRSGDGEVLAHFAQIDGDFVAVSSLNHEVYKGTDIREIVDRMLENHPLVVPNNRASGQLYLHPTAAITAFLAAAFLLNVDGVKLSSVEQIIVAVSTKGPSALAGAAISVQAIGKGDIAKWGQLDAASSNYNVVILGAALLAHELGRGEIFDAKATGLETVSVDANDNAIKGKAESDIGTLTKGIPDFMFLSSRITDQDSGGSGNKLQQVSTALNKNKPKEGQELQLNLSNKHFSSEAIVENSSSFISSWESSGSELKAHYRSNNKTSDAKKITSGDVNENFVSLQQISLKEANERDDPSLYPEKTSEAPIFNFDLATLVDLENLQISADNIDNKDLVAFKGVELTSDMVFLDMSLPTVFAGDTALGLMPLEDQFEVSQAAEGSADIEASTTATITPQHSLPIIGHTTIESVDVVDMTAGIDVVFYQGGDVEIKGFELGVDLLWFFLSEDELETGQNTVNSRGDVVLDFGEKGSLVFLGLVPNSPDDILI
tara:strand:+ start:2467 stop:4110 length:1644 start_codon:yes stop_codon:yes gene_type:complete